MNGYERITAMLAGEPVDRVPLMPITMMFAADKIGVPYGKYATDHNILVEAQLKTADMFDFDYVSCISDPAREAADCGASVHMFDDQPPAIDEVNSLLAEKSKLKRIDMPEVDTGRMLDRIKAAELFREQVGGEKYIEGWVEGPLAEAADLRGINRLMTDFFDDPDFVRDLFDFTLELGMRFAEAQIHAGVDIVGIGDAAASLVGPQIYKEFVVEYERKLVEHVQQLGAAVRMHICGNITRILEPVGSLGCEMVDIDSMVPLSDCRKAMGDVTVLAGNIDPVAVLRNGTPESITNEIAECHRQSGDRYIIAAGCEVPRDTPDENVMALRDYARSTG